MSINAPTQSAMHYPESDGEPMAETDTHRDLMLALIFALQEYLRNTVAYVSGNLFLYFQEGHPEQVIAPDVFVVLGVPQEPHRTYKTWEHGGKVPDVVFELTSAKTRAEDLGHKRIRYAELGVREYILFDPLGDYLKPQLQLYELVDDEYYPIGGARLRSRVLDLELRVEGDQLRLYEVPSGRPLLTPDTIAAALAEAEAEAQRQAAARLAAEAEAQQQARARLAAAAEAQQQARARLAAEAASRQQATALHEAEAEVARLRAEVARLRGE